MPALDRFRGYPSIPFANANNGNRQYSPVDNNVRYERANLTISGNVAIGAVNAASLANRGSILSLAQQIGFEDAGLDVVNADARLMGVYADAFSTRPRFATRLTAAQLVIGNANLIESVPIWLAAPQTVNPAETKYSEVNKQSLLRFFVNPNVPTAAANQFGGVANPGAGTTFTWTALKADVTAVYDNMVTTPPLYTAYLRQITVPVTAALNGFKIDLRGTRYVRAIVIQQDSAVGEVSDIISALVLRGDDKSIFGDKSIPFVDLQHMLGEEQGLDPVSGYLCIDMCRFGRLKSMWNPFQDTNFRLELDTTVSASGSPVVRVLMVEYQKTDSTHPDPHVKP